MSGAHDAGADPIDLRSDTVTRPTAAMLEAMRTAPLGDDSRDGDPTVVRLERLAAAKVGKAAALFLPSGTMGNLIAVLAHVTRGSDVLVDPLAHLVGSEMAGLVGVAGVAPRPVASRAGRYDLAALEQALATPPSGRVGAGLVWLESSHNGAGGRILPVDHIGEVCRLARLRGVPVHLDGARLFNAAVALGIGADVIAAPVDSVMVCVSKGLAAPVGSLLAGSAELIVRARALRRMLGGAMRQAGVIAAAGIVALETMVERLADDHAVARRLATGLAALDPTLLDPATVETNILRLDVSRTGRSASAWASALDAAGIRVQASGASQLRMVTHRHVDMAAADRVVAAAAAVA
ncbi:GntG family PLP-dependent aldolase [Rhodoplanes sp. TEM]|uniref:GntG family PLP-dependent aldolase n=1 Tax=Rhodoplanes tepidamans TaxID=200616 RepID=A0ABT5JIC5_RHOTP|nr:MULTISPECIES: GntG family PLP-dependent aldolase [Rhodoplanes]MDC7789459.1 GntG family PLP-dependent aldolase [Rhodoplanes tepidamans]MDC7986994.1 GntG family PLP-dependent aldolase [Rhodoplanes sp. TEM]MDQ0359026.1 threonine aldolase [Rhodoplanes tepidamans]